MPIYWKTWNFADDPFDSRCRKLYDSALMSIHVPDFVNPIRAAEGGLSISGQLAFTRMKRLLEVAGNPEGVAEVALDFAIDGQGIPYVRGQVRADVVLVCQRCLEPMTLHVDTQVCVGIVASEEEAARLPEQYDPLIARGEQLLIAEAVEDEILLALPPIPRHDPAECAVSNNVERRQGGGEEADAASRSPFAVLAQLKGKH